MNSEERLAELFLKIGKQFKKSLSDVDSKMNCTHKDMRILEYLFTGPKTMSELSHEMELTPGTMTTAIDKLVKNKFVKRVYDIEDRRKVSVMLMKKGLHIATSMHDTSLLVAKNMLEVLSLKDQEKMISLLDTSINGINDLKNK